MAQSSYAIIDTTLREGEQFAGASFTSADRMRVAEALADFGVEMVELTSPCASPASQADVSAVSRRLGNGKTRVTTHIRCNLEDAKVAVDTGVHGISTVIGLSPQLRAASHGMDPGAIVDYATEVLSFIREQRPDVILRFSTEDTFRALNDDWLTVYRRLARLGVCDRFGIADTTGGADPFTVQAVVGELRQAVDTDIEFHGHNDTDCAVANAFAAWRGGATHIDTSIMGIGERNGIASLEGFLARMYAQDPAGTKAKYQLDRLPALAEMVAEVAGVPVPFNQAVVGAAAFTHKAGIHTNAVLRAPDSYEILRPEDFGRVRSLEIAHKLTGRNAITARAVSLGYDLDRKTLKAVTLQVKALADVGPVDLGALDALLAFAARTRR
jgi:homocitrate synthase